MKKRLASIFLSVSMLVGAVSACGANTEEIDPVSEFQSRLEFLSSMSTYSFNTVVDVIPDMTNLNLMLSEQRSNLGGTVSLSGVYDEISKQASVSTAVDIVIDRKSITGSNSNMLMVRDNDAFLNSHTVYDLINSYTPIKDDFPYEYDYVHMNIPRSFGIKLWSEIESFKNKDETSDLAFVNDYKNLFLQDYILTSGEFGTNENAAQMRVLDIDMPSLYEKIHDLTLKDKNQIADFMEKCRFDGAYSLGEDFRAYQGTEFESRSTSLRTFLMQNKITADFYWYLYQDNEDYISDIQILFYSDTISDSKAEILSVEIKSTQTPINTDTESVSSQLSFPGSFEEENSIGFVNAMFKALATKITPEAAENSETSETDSNDDSNDTAEQILPYNLFLSIEAPEIETTEEEPAPSSTPIPSPSPKPSEAPAESAPPSEEEEPVDGSGSETPDSGAPASSETTESSPPEDAGTTVTVSNYFTTITDEGRQYYVIEDDYRYGNITLQVTDDGNSNSQCVGADAWSATIELTDSYVVVGSISSNFSDVSGMYASRFENFQSYYSGSSASPETITGDYHYVSYTPADGNTQYTLFVRQISDTLIEEIILQTESSTVTSAMIDLLG